MSNPISQLIVLVIVRLIIYQSSCSCSPTDETTNNLHQNQGKRKVHRKSERLMIWSISLHLPNMVEAVLWYSMGMYSCQSNWVTGRMNSDMYWTIISAQIQANVKKLIGQPFTAQMDNEPKNTAKITQEHFQAKERNIITWLSQLPDLNQTELLFTDLRQNWRQKDTKTCKWP